MFRNYIAGNVASLEMSDFRSPTILESLTKQVRASTAISLPSLTLTRIACAGVILDSSGKMKIFESAGIDGTKFILSKIVASASKTPFPL